VWDFDENDLTSPDKLAARLSGLELERAEVRRLDGVFAEEDMRASAGTSANIVFLRARKI